MVSLRVASGNTYHFLVLNAFMADRQIISGMSTNEEAMRALGKQLAANLQLNYFDETNASSHRTFLSSFVLCWGALHGRRRPINKAVVHACAHFDVSCMALHRCDSPLPAARDTDSDASGQCRVSCRPASAARHADGRSFPAHMKLFFVYTQAW